MDKEEFLSEEEYQSKLKEQKKIRQCCERIIKRYYNPQNIVLTEEDYRALSNGVKIGDANAERELREKATFNAYNIVTDMFVKGEITSDFQDALQNTYLFMQGADMTRLSSSKTLRGFQTASQRFLKDGFARIDKVNKVANLDLQGQRVPLSEIDRFLQVDCMQEIFKGGQKRALAKACSTLKEFECRVLREIYVEDKTRSQVGQEAGLTGKRIFQIENRALRKLRLPPRSIGLKDYVEQ